MIQGSWDQQVEDIIDVKLGNANADSYKYEPMVALLGEWKIVMKENHGNHCNDQRKHFSLFALSVDRKLGMEALVILPQLN